MFGQKKDFPIFSAFKKPLIYFDNAATTQKPLSVIQAMNEFYLRYNGPVSRSLYYLAEKTTQLYDLARKRVSLFLNASYQEIVFTSGATHAINMIAQGWVPGNMQAGDEILITQLEHHSNLVTWQQCAKRYNLTLKILPVLKDGTLDYQQLETLITQRTRLIAVSYVSNALGTQVDISLIVPMAQSVGARVLIDASQAAPHQVIDVKKLKCDFLVFSSHKMLGPTGIGVLYMQEPRFEEVQPSMYGGGMVFEVFENNATWQQAPYRYEAGSPPVAQAIGLHAAIDYISSYSFSELIAYEASLCRHLIDGLLSIKHIKVLGPIEQLKKRGHLVSFIHGKYHFHDVAAYFDQFNICVRAGHYCAQPLARALNIDGSVRVSFYLYNTIEEIDEFLNRLQAMEL